jgi:hypothetical protein
VYAGSFFALAIMFNVLWRYAVRAKIVYEELNVALITKQYSLGPILYAMLVILAFFSAEWCLVISILIAVYFALPPSLWSRQRSSR